MIVGGLVVVAGAIVTGAMSMDRTPSSGAGMALAASLAVVALGVTVCVLGFRAAS